MQLSEEYKPDNLAYKFYPNLLNAYSLLLEYWQEDNDVLNILIITSLGHFWEYLKFTLRSVQFATGQSKHTEPCLFSD